MTVEIVILDQIWKVRNKKVHEELLEEMEQINRVVSNRIREHSNCCNLSMDQDNIPAPIHWKAPRFGTLKINCDAAIDTHFSSIALVARDLRGSVVLVMSKKVYTTSPL